MNRMLNDNMIYKYSFINILYHDEYKIFIICKYNNYDEFLIFFSISISILE